ncbi:unnamed protein product [Paramecium octaurelia]|uniref:Uncharacterized protein n=1 Tax=Paramecium octaurelia TaxID=43137 RepID=A0A8S1S9V5_PAROT|nr:unnamed protein product [Paramecium octaurelia]
MKKFDKNYCGIIVEFDQIKQDAKDNYYREVVFKEVIQNKNFEGRNIYVRMYSCLEVSLYDMVFFQNYRIYKDADSINQVRLECDRKCSIEYQGNSECKYICDREMYRKMKCLQQRKRQFQTKQVQTRLEDYFKK